MERPLSASACAQLNSNVGRKSHHARLGRYIRPGNIGLYLSGGGGVVFVTEWFDPTIEADQLYLELTHTNV
jgi:hypothetical protein